MWTEIRNTLIQVENLSGVKKDSVRRANHYTERPGEVDYHVRLFSSGECWQTFTFQSEEAQKACYDLIKDKIIVCNYNRESIDVECS